MFKRKCNYIGLLIFVISLSMTACGDSSANNDAVSLDDVVVYEEGSSSIESIEAAPEVDPWLEAASAESIQNLQEIMEKAGIEAYVDALRDEKFADNIFANEVIEVFDNSNYSNWTDLEKDFIESYIHSYFPSSQTTQMFDGDFEISKVWAAGYDDETVSSTLEYQRRYIVLQFSGSFYTGGTSFENYTDDIMEWLVFHEDYYGYGTDTYRKQVIKNKEKFTDMDISLDEGIFTYTATDKTEYEIPFYSVDMSQINDYITNNQELIDVFVKYQTEVYLPQYKIVIEERNEKLIQENKEYEPAIGMTKAQVTGSTWGEPEKKNIDEYAWGVNEQWVYSGKGYIYFTDGIVMAIQHRD